ncbi:hypothetical protein I5E68_12225 [Novosphingobium sp. YJ-S2-02]|uniref:Uncharacterized protein n=1 Tax=Novosphingobium aureum TaxID=2792964 RepID=A0A931HE51_9SPHN|nr:hypothetical protein [Novosphingobium aureum]MBH0113714.1 hypothetical protein [Novosphingobium aureum]
MEARRPIAAAWIEAGCWVILLGMFAGLCGRILSYPLNRDENLFVTAAAMVFGNDLYTDLGYNHLPYLAWGLGAIFRLSGTEHFLLTGRIVICLGWLATLLALRLIAFQLSAGFTAFFCAACLFLGNVLLLGSAGMLVSNNLLPIPFALFALAALIRGMDEENPSPVACFIAGLAVSCAIGLKANYIVVAPVVFLATVLAPPTRPAAARFSQASMPLALGGLVGGLPVLVLVFRDPGGFFAHTLRYFTQLQPAYWAASHEPKVVGAAAKVLLAESIWGANTALLAMVGVAGLIALPMMRGAPVRARAMIADWPVVLCLALALLGFVVAFVPSPAFPQYFVPPIPFLILAVIALRARCETIDRPPARALLATLALVAMTGSASRLAPGLIQLARPAAWAPNALHRDLRALAREAGLSPRARAATLTPVLALEAGLAVPREFAAGQFVYRVAPFIPADEAVHYTTTSPRHLEAYLEQSAPEAIVTSGEETLEEPFDTFARSHGYEEFTRRRGGHTLRLFRKPITD